LLTVPLAAAGIFPGLILSDSPFGFQPLLGVIALVGIVVNNAIVLIDYIDQQLRAGADLATAVDDAVARRTRPILLTTATTVTGLLPLAFSSSTLWPPMAWAIISGLLASTMLTLLVVPAVCRLSLRQRIPKVTEMTPSLDVN
jgi:multidrug efflux pump subunit AcrB